jgi:hypothetical protein
MLIDNRCLCHLKRFIVECFVEKSAVSSCVASY